MKSSIIVLFIVIGTTCFYTANTQDDFDYYGEEEDTEEPPTITAPSTGSGMCSNIMAPMSECELPQPALKARLKTEEDALILADCWLHCLDMFFSESDISEITELEGFPNIKTLPASVLNSAQNRIEVFECRRGCEARAFDPQRTTQNCTTACVDNCEHFYREERCLRDMVLFDSCNRSLCQLGCAFQSPPGMPQRVPIIPTNFPELNPPECKERAGVYHIGNVSSFTKLNASFNSSGYTTYVFRVQSMDNASLSTYIWLPESTHRLLLSEFACSNVSISYAVVSRTNMTQYSPVLNLSVYGANQDPANGFPHQVDYRSVATELEPDDRSEFIQNYWTFRFSWERPLGNLTGYRIEVNYQSSQDRGNMTYNLSQDATSFSFLSNSNTSIFLRANSIISRLQIITMPIAVNAEPTVIECLLPLPNIQQVINHTTLQLTCVSQWNSSRYQYNTGLHFNVSESSFITFVDLFHITGRLIDKGGDIRMSNVLKQIKPRSTDNDTQIEFTYQGDYQDPDVDEDYQFVVITAYKTSNVQQLPPLAESCQIALVPPSPLPPVNVTVQSSSISHLNPSHIVVTVDFMLHQVNETSARTEDLKHECNITTAPEMNSVTKQTNTMLVGENEFQGSDIFTVQVNPNFTCLYVQLRSMYSVPVPQDQFFRSAWSSPVVLYRSPDQTNCSLPFDDSGSGEFTNSPTPTVIDSFTDYSTRTILLSILVPLGIIMLIFSILIILFCCFVIKRRRKMKYDSYNGDRAYKEMQLIFSGKHNGSAECSIEHEDIVLQLDDWELNPEDIVIDEKLGEGAFGEVYKGIVAETHNNPHLEGFLVRNGSGYVALKFLKEGASGSERLDFIKEIELMKKIADGNNSHVVNMVGCITIQEPLCLVTEFAEHGDLQTFLKTCRKQLIERKRNTETAESLYSDLGELKSEDLVSFAYQIASGMDFLASLNVVHRDLACRNILVGKGKSLKITDFGLSRLLSHDNVYVKTTQGRMPLKWMSIESIVDREYTTASDVWSYGVTLWEIATLGSMPYPTINNEDMLVMLKRGYRMERPENCSVEVYELMLQCWQEHPSDRPKFVQLRGEFDRMLSKQKNAEELYIFIQAEEMIPAEEPPKSKIASDEKPEDPAQLEMGDDDRPVNPYVDQPVATTPADHQHYLSLSVGGTSPALTPK